jgi:hypothetical protein
MAHADTKFPRRIAPIETASNPENAKLRDFRCQHRDVALDGADIHSLFKMAKPRFASISGGL